jgi:hypothetical protein
MVMASTAGLYAAGVTAIIKTMLDTLSFTLRHLLGLRSTWPFRVDLGFFQSLNGFDALILSDH